LYTGITTDVDRRFNEHQNSAKGAKYTRADPPVAIEFVQQLDDRSAATKREIEIKKLSRAKKMALIVSSSKD
jgi:putative endonuclease